MRYNACAIAGSKHTNAGNHENLTDEDAENVNWKSLGKARWIQLGHSVQACFSFHHVLHSLIRQASCCHSALPIARPWPAWICSLAGCEPKRGLRSSEPTRHGRSVGQASCGQQNMCKSADHMLGDLLNHGSSPQQATEDRVCNFPKDFWLGCPT